MFVECGAAYKWPKSDSGIVKMQECAEDTRIKVQSVAQLPD